MKNWFILLILLPFSVFSQFSKTHYLPPISTTNSVTAEEIYLYISTPSLSWVEVNIVRLGQPALQVQVSRDYPYVLNLGSDTASPFIVGSYQAAQIISNKGIVIEANDMVYAAVRLIGGQSNHAGELVSKGMAALGKDFRIGTMTNTLMEEYSNTHHSFATVFATENNTKITISDVKPGARLLNNETQNGPFEITLNSGQSYILAAQGPFNTNRDALIGSRIQADKPIVVNCGSVGGTNGEMRNMDFGFDQIVPVERVGTDYIFIKNSGLPEVEKILLVSIEDQTEIFVGNQTTPIATLNAGDYYTLNGNQFTSLGNLYVRASKNVYAFQSIGDNIREDQANQEMFFVPPLSCETPHTINNIPDINKIGSREFSNSRITLVTESGSTLNFLVDGNSFTLTGLATLGAQVEGPLPIEGNTAFETYTISGLSGNVGVSSTSQLYLASYGSSEAATFGGYFSGFTFKPEIVTQALDATSAACLPNLRLEVNELSGYDTYQWYFNDNPIAGANSAQFTPTEPGYYYVKAALSNCTTEMSSSPIAVSLCAVDRDSDGSIDNTDLDWDNDGISNCEESMGTQNLHLGSMSYGTVSAGSYSNPFTGVVQALNNNSPNGSLFSTDIEGVITGRTSPGIGTSVRYTLNFTNPLAIEVLEANSAIAQPFSVNAEFHIRVPFNRTITILNPSDQLLIDTNSDGVFENGITEFTSFEIRIRRNPSVSIQPGQNGFSIQTAFTEQLQIELFNRSETEPTVSSLQIRTPCIYRDSDFDGIPDYWDLDSDNDGILDQIEAHAQPLTSTWLDADQNGWNDAFQNTTPLDTDQDGVPDYLDLDSDNNGIYDALESGYAMSDSNADGRIDGPYGPNGFSDSLETTIESGIPNQVLTYSSTSPLPDYRNPDNDGDQCPDVNEAGFQNADNDHYLGTSPVQVNAYGMVLNWGGYSAAHPNVFISGLIEIIDQPTQLVSCAYTSLIIPIQINSGVAIAWEYQKPGETFVPATAPLFDNTQLPNLILNQVTSDWDGTLFRAVLTHPNNSCEVFSEPIALQIQSGPTSTSQTLTQCQTDPSRYGNADFLLYQAKSLFLTNDNFQVEFYRTESDALTATDALPDSLENGLNGQQLWARITDLETGCFGISTLLLEVNDLSIQTGNHRVLCEDEDQEDGFHSFNLYEGVSAATSDVSFYTSIEDALLDKNEIADPQYYVNQLAYAPEKIYVRETDGIQCIGIYSFELGVMPLPELASETRREFYLCAENPTEIAHLDARGVGMILYSWTKDNQPINGLTTATFSTSEPGTYVAHLTNMDGCVREVEFHVYQSGQAVIEQLLIQDLQDNATVEVQLSAASTGNYGFALDSLLNYQAENVFTSVTPGIHTLYIKDWNGCATTTVTFHVLGIPKFFSPNGDGHNETWNLKGVDLELHAGTRITIFDRYGKLIKQLAASGEGWDGTILGNPAPATDYWYRIEMPDGRIVKGHFSLIR